MSTTPATVLDHPDLQPPASAERASRSVRMRDAARSTHGAPLFGHYAPFGVTTLLWAGATAGHASTRFAQVVAVAAPVIAVVLWWVWARRRTREQRRALRSRTRYTTAVFVAALAWFLTAAQFGAGGWRGMTLWLGMVAVMQPYWRARRIPVPPPRDEIPAEVVEEVLVGDVVEKWEQRVAAKGKSLPGSTLVNHRQVKNGDVWDIRLKPGEQTTQQAISALIIVVSALEPRTLDQVVIDRHPSGSLALATLTVTTGHPLNATLHHPGAKAAWFPKLGKIQIGVHPDGEPALWSLCLPGYGMCHGFLLGGTGSGKSTLLTNLVASAAHSGYVTIWAADIGKKGASFPAVAEHASWLATEVDEFILMLRAAKTLVETRGTLLDLRGLDLHVPSPAEPGVLLVLDEMSSLLAGHERAREATELLEAIARKGRFAGIGVVGADQTLNLDKTFGNSDAIKSQMFMHNVWVGRTQSQVQVGLIPNLEGVDPRQIPDTFPDGSLTQGLGYLIGGRTAPCRGWFTPPERGREIMATAPQLELDKAAAGFITRAHGDAYSGRKLRAEYAKASNLLLIQDVSPELADELLLQYPHLRERLEELRRNPKLGVVVAPEVAPTGAVEAGPHGFGNGFAAAPTFDAEAAEAPAARGSTAKAKGPTVKEKVFALLTAGQCSMAALIVESKHPESSVRLALSELMDVGLVDRPVRGEYVLTDEGKRQAA